MKDQPDPQDVLVPVWHMRWASPRTLREWDASGTPYMTDKRLVSLVQEAQRAGFREGERQGRANLRDAIEKGEVRLPEPFPGPTSDTTP